MREEPPRRAEPVGRLGPGAASVVLLVSQFGLMFGLGGVSLLGREVPLVALRVPFVAVAAGGLWFFHFRRVIPWIERHTPAESISLRGFGVHSRAMYRFGAVVFGLAVLALVVFSAFPGLVRT